MKPSIARHAAKALTNEDDPQVVLLLLLPEDVPLGGGGGGVHDGRAQPARDAVAPAAVVAAQTVGRAVLAAVPGRLGGAGEGEAPEGGQPAPGGGTGGGLLVRGNGGGHAHRNAGKEMLR